MNAARIGLVLGTLTATSGLSLAAVPIVLEDAAADLGLQPGATAWILAAVSLTLAVTTPLWGRIADLRGLRLVLAVGMGLTIAGAIGAVLAQSFEVLLVARLVQGAGVGAVSLTAFSTAGAILEGHDLRVALGVMTAESSIALGAGPLIGAAVGDAFGWEYVLVLPALGVLAWPWVHRLAPASSGSAGSLDVGGATLALVAGGALTTLLQARATHLGAPAAAFAAVVSVVAVAALWRHARRNPKGFLPVGLLANRAYVRLCLAAGLMFGGYLGMAFAAPLMLSDLRGWSALQIGVVLLPAALVSAITAHTVGSLGDRYSPVVALAFFAGASGVSLLIAAVGGASPICVVIGAVGGICGFAAAQVLVLAAIPSLVDVAVAGVAVGVFNYVFVTGGAVGTALVGAIADVASFRAGIAVLALAPLGAVVLALGARVAPVGPRPVDVAI